MSFNDEYPLFAHRMERGDQPAVRCVHETVVDDHCTRCGKPVVDLGVRR